MSCYDRFSGDNSHLVVAMLPVLAPTSVPQSWYAKPRSVMENLEHLEKEEERLLEERARVLGTKTPAIGVHFHNQRRIRQGAAPIDDPTNQLLSGTSDPRLYRYQHEGDEDDDELPPPTRPPHHRVMPR